MISLLVPTRGRPQQLAAMWYSAMDTAQDPNDLELVIRIDDDDRSYNELMEHRPPGNVAWLVGPRIVLSELWNEAWRVANGEIFMHCSDDIRFRTNDWDTRVIRAIGEYDDRILFVHGRDGIQDNNCGTHGFISKDWTDAVGYFVPPYYSSDYNDLHLTIVADKLGRRRYDPEIFTEHMHPVANKGPMDQTHLDRLARHNIDQVDRIWVEKAYTRDEDAAKLAAVIQSQNGGG